MSKSFKELAADFGYLAEDAKNMETDIAGQLDKAMKMDEVESVTFGLETDDGKIVKVYVKAEEADDFEKALSKKLGSEDSIEAALNELSKNFEIIDVEWPEDDEEDDDDTDVNDDDKPETDGSESLNKEVYGDGKGGKKSKDDKSQYKTKMEGLSFGERFTHGLIEANDKENHSADNQHVDAEQHDDLTAPLEKRLKTTNQQLVYHAILELGVPEHVLNKSTFRLAILNGIRKKASELDDSNHLRNTIRSFVKKSIDEGIDAKSHVLPLAEANTVADSFFDTITNLINFLDSSPNKRYASSLITSSPFKELMSSAKPELSQKITSQIQVKLDNLNKVIQTTNTPSEEVSESMNSKQFSDFIGGFLGFIDPTENKQLFGNVQKSSQYKQYINGTQSSLSSKLSGVVSQRLSDLQNVLASIYKSQEQQSKQTQGSTPPTASTQATTESKIVEAEVTNAGAKWVVTKDDDDNTVISYGTLKAVLNDEAIEKLNKAIKNRAVLTVHDINEKDKYIFSPRGKTVLVKKVGFGSLQGTMQEEDVENLLGLTDKE